MIMTKDCVYVFLYILTFGMLLSLMSQSMLLVDDDEDFEHILFQKREII